VKNLNKPLVLDTNTLSDKCVHFLNRGDSIEKLRTLLRKSGIEIVDMTPRTAENAAYIGHGEKMCRKRR